MSLLAVPPELAAHFRAHNRRATWLAAICLAASIAAWSAVYGAIYWAKLLFLTSLYGADIEGPGNLKLPFLIFAILLFVIGSAVRTWKTQNEKFHPLLAIFTLFSIPARLTFAVWENFFARVHLSDSELAGAWALLEILREEKKIPATNLPALLPAGVAAGRVAHILSITNLLDTDDYGGVYFHHFRNQEAETLVRRWTRSLQLED